MNVSKFLIVVIFINVLKVKLFWGKLILEVVEENLCVYR